VSLLSRLLISIDGQEQIIYPSLCLLCHYTEIIRGLLYLVFPQPCDPGFQVPKPLLTLLNLDPQQLYFPAHRSSYYCMPPHLPQS